MTRTTFLISIYLFIRLCHTHGYTYYVDGDRNVTIITENDIKEFRAKTYVEPIDEIKDLDINEPDVIEILDKIKELERSGYDILNTVPDNGATCSVQVKFYVTAIIDRAKEQCDFCVQANARKENPTIMNAEQKQCSLDIIETSQNELYKLKYTVERCRLFI